ncbi:effector-associated constant component EACC1 [Streptomyces lydicus]|uniref:effector-associated constant component EACC1 n=1 Tax=Streptomyces lydicus TaxID=47763 RepID=UPI0036EAA84B
MTTLTFAFDGPADDADGLAQSLAEWLNDDEDLTGAARLRMVPPAPGHQGGLADAAEVLGAVGPVLEAVVSAVAVWLAQRARSRRISFKVTRPDGTALELSAGSPEDAAAVEQQLRRFLEPGSVDGS